MPASILCPVDFSDESLIVLRRAALIAKRSGARLAALHVADELLVHAAAGAYHGDVVMQDTQRALQEAVDTVHRETAACGPPIGAYVVAGDPAAEICRFCTRHGIDLIIMASHYLTRYRRLVFGSVTDAVVRSAPAPVLVFPPHPRTSTLCVTINLDRAATSDA